MVTIKVTHVTNDATNDSHNYLIAGMPNCFCHIWRVLMANCGCKWVTTGAIRFADSRRINRPLWNGRVEISSFKSRGDGTGSSMKTNTSHMMFKQRKVLLISWPSRQSPVHLCTFSPSLRFYHWIPATAPTKVCVCGGVTFSFQLYNSCSIME